MRNTPAYSIWKRLSFRRPDPNRGFATITKPDMGFPHDVIYLQLSHTLERDAAKAAYDKAQFLPQRHEMMQTYADYLDELRDVAHQKNAI